ncbi:MULTISPECIES: hypothetical protein [Pseudomonas]|uniref:hypothetical protein n=1 Tax=Pseudomonas nitroreducens TaxID=46680 RepID=UPI001E380D0D|nr:MULTISPECIES: hypothetical protein [Pseudomonas]MCE4070147.1 hypothetical protein [Pseudomonas nitritireducens]MCE4078752.1 hypothetical protein [Pseudomonas nitroreducens]
MKEAIPKPQLESAVISANVSTGFRPTTKDGKPLRMALVDEAGCIIEIGEDVALAAWRVCIEVQENFWQGQGHLVVHSAPPTQALPRAAA